MAVNKKHSQQSLSLDPAVDVNLQNSSEQQAVNRKREQEARLTKSQRRKRQKDKSRSKATYDLRPDMIERIEQIAEQHSVPKNQLVGLFLYHALRDYDRGHIDIQLYKRPSRVPRFDSFLHLPDEDDGWQVSKPSGWGHPA